MMKPKSLKAKKGKIRGWRRLLTIKKTLVLLFILVIGGIGAYQLKPSGAATFDRLSADVQFLRLTAWRAQNGRPALFRSKCLSDTAQQWANYMADTQQQIHSDNFNRILYICGGRSWYELRSAGENIHNGWSPAIDSNNLFDFFANSAGHNANMLNGEFNKVGIGAARDGSGKLWIVQTFAQAWGAQYDVPYTSADPVAYVGLAAASNAKGYKAENFGGIHPFGGAANISSSGYWPNKDIVRSIAMNKDGKGYKLDKFGGLHPFAGAPKAYGGAYWPNWDIARDVKMYGSTTRGYVLDGYGGLHKFNGARDANWSAYWLGKDIAKKFVINSNGSQGYVLANTGSLHPFSTRKADGKWYPWPPAISNGPWFDGKPLARSVIMNPAATKGYVLDAHGGIHPFSRPGHSKPPAIKNGPYWSSGDVARDIIITSWTTSVPRGWVLDVLGGLHRFGN